MDKVKLDKIAGVLMDSHIQKHLMDNPEDPDCWMLKYVFDSHEREKFHLELEKEVLKKDIVINNNEQVKLVL